MRPTIALLPSALLGPAAWSPVAELLRSDGRRVVEVPRVLVAPQSPAAQLGRYLEALPTDEPLVVVPHSNAGLFVPAITAERQVEAMVFVDAGVPPPTGPYDLAPPDFYRFLEGLADADGLLPVWSSWWPDEVATLFPSPEVRAVVEAEQSRLSLGYFAGSLTASTGWDQRPAAFLGFGDTYAADQDDATGRGWVVKTIAGQHLHLLIDPGTVAATLDRLITDLLR